MAELKLFTWGFEREAEVFENVSSENSCFDVRKHSKSFEGYLISFKNINFFVNFAMRKEACVDCFFFCVCVLIVS